ncbi:MAG TPA: SigE family RNA polymerase sigma factor [Actinomycetales bacterium]|nr:SigE family RNA polymerase sigma factor [Actinomycetales bacterium]
MDDESFRRFVVARRPALLRTAWLLTGDADEAEDLVQTALECTARHWRRVAARGDAEPYVRRALHHAHISAWRRTRSRVREVLGHQTAESEVDDRTSDRDTAMLMRQALARLTPRQRAVLVLRYYEDLTEPQVASVMGTSVGTVKSQVRHALGRLRQLAPELGEVAPRDPSSVEGRLGLLEREASS